MGEASNIMERLKSATSDLHQAAEQRVLQRELARGALPRDLYVAFLGQMLLVHEALEAAIRLTATRHRAFGAVVREHHTREGALRSDLDHLAGGTWVAEPLPAARLLIREIERARQEEPAALLGMLYVLEGSTNGSKFIAAAMSRRQGLKPGPGLGYLDPHGDHQKDRWQAFKSDMNAVGFSETESAAVIEAAMTMFRGIADLSDELMEPAAADLG